MQLNKLKLPLIAVIIVGVISLFGWFQYSRLQDLKIKTLYYTENNFNRLYYEVRYEILKESYMGGFDNLPKLTEDVINNPQSAELLDIAQKLKRENSLSHQVFLGLLKLPGHSIDLYYLDSTFIPTQLTLEDTLVINALVAFRDLLPTGDSYGEDYSLQLTDQKILLTEPLLLQKNNQMIGFIGLLIHTEKAGKQLLPKIFNKYVFPEDSLNFAIRVRDHALDKYIYGTTKQVLNESRKPDMIYSIPHVFKKWFIEAFMLKNSFKDIAIKEFYQNLLITVFALLVVLIGFLVIIRTAHKEQRLSQMKSEFIANISHELKTPLSIIQVAGENLKNQKISNNEKLKQYGLYIFKEAQRLIKIVERILNLVQMEGGSLVYHFEKQNINKIIREVYKSYEFQLRELSFRSCIQLQKKLPEIEIDKVLFIEALHNLIDNAIKYANENKYLGITSSTNEKEIRLTVEDKGIGIHPRDQRYIFERFYRVVTSDKHNHKGVGLGLAFVKKVVKAHHGRIEVSSKIGKGTIFSIYLPVK